MHNWHLDPPVCFQCLPPGCTVCCLKIVLAARQQHPNSNVENNKIEILKFNYIENGFWNKKTSKNNVGSQSRVHLIQWNLSAVFRRVTSECGKTTLGPINLIPCRGDPPLSLHRLPVFPRSITGNRRRARRKAEFPTRWRRWVALWQAARWRRSNVVNKVTEGRLQCAELGTQLPCLGAVIGIAPYWLGGYYSGAGPFVATFKSWKNIGIDYTVC